MLDLPEDEEVVWNGEAFKDMKNLKILIIKNAHFSHGPKYLPNSLRILDWTSYPSSSLPQHFHPRNLVILNLTNGLFDFDKPLQKFKLLTWMELGNTCINECRHLKKLVLDNCHQLQTIIDIPSIEYLTAIDCTKLTSQSSSILLSQKLHEDGKTYFTLPGSKIPEWFDHSCQRSSLCFWFRKSFPSIALCLVHFASIAPVHIRTIQLRVNSHKIDLEHFGIYWTSNTDVEHVSLFDLEGKIQFSRSDVELKEYIKDGWNHVEVKVEDIKWIGVHVYKQITNRENIIFGYTPTGSKKRKRVHQ